jgi:hypothetical protein
MALTLEEQEELKQLQQQLGVDSQAVNMQNSVMSPDYMPPSLGQQLYRSTVDVLPEMGGMVGGAAGALLTRNPAGVRGGAAVGQQAIRSLIGAGVGGATGEAGKQALLNQPSVTSLLRSGVEQAVYDGFGTLIFTYGGKAYRFTKDQFKNLTKSDALPDSAIQAAQQLLAQQKLGATLTPYQATGNSVDALKESIARGSFTGKPIITKNEQNVQKALEAAKTTILDDISKEVYDGISAGQSFQTAIKTGDAALKARVEPFYDALSSRAGGAFDVTAVDMSALKAYAKKEKDELAGLGGFGATGAEDVFTKINQIDPKLSFAKAHRLLSSLKTELRELQRADQPSANAERVLNRAIQTLEGQMDKAGGALKGTAMSFDGRLPTDGTQTLADQYKLYSKFYRDGLNDLYSNTTSRLLNKDPELVGQTVFQSGRVTAFQDVKRALTKAKELNPELNVTDTINSVRRGYLETLLKSDNLTNISTKLKNDPSVRRTFEEILSKDQRERVKTLLLAAERSADVPTSPGALFFAAQQAQATATVLSLGALALSPEAQRIASENPAWATAIAGTIILGPRFLAKAATKPEATNAALQLIKSQSKNIPMSGPVLLKTLQAFDKAGIQPEDMTGTTDEMAPSLTREEEEELRYLEEQLGQPE